MVFFGLFSRKVNRRGAYLAVGGASLLLGIVLLAITN
jgi:hypothetical protein